MRYEKAVEREDEGDSKTNGYAWKSPQKPEKVWKKFEARVKTEITKTSVML